MSTSARKTTIHECGTVLTVAVALLCSHVSLGCRDSQRQRDEAQIRSTYTAFRNALLQNDYRTATNFVYSHYLSFYAPTQVMEDFATITWTNMELSRSSWVRFARDDRSNATLYPNRGPTVGYEFNKETNGWKITLNVTPIVD